MTRPWRDPTFDPATWSPPVPILSGVPVTGPGRDPGHERRLALAWCIATVLCLVALTTGWLEVPRWLWPFVVAP